MISGFAEFGFVRNAELFTGLCNRQAVGKRCGVVVLVCCQVDRRVRCIHVARKVKRFDGFRCDLRSCHAAQKRGSPVVHRMTCRERSVACIEILHADCGVGKKNHFRLWNACALPAEIGGADLTCQSGSGGEAADHVVTRLHFKFVGTRLDLPYAGVHIFDGFGDDGVLLCAVEKDKGGVTHLV